MENQKYVEPKFEVTEFDTCDVITTSGGPTGGGGGIVLPDDEWQYDVWAFIICKLVECISFCSFRLF